MAVIQGNQVISASESSRAKARSATPTARSPKLEPTPADQPIAAAEPVRRARTGDTVVTSTEAPIFGAPGYPTPLRVVSAGSVLRVVAVQDDWYRVEFKDPQWGTRVGFVAVTSTRANSTASSLSEPMDLSIQELRLNNSNRWTFRSGDPNDQTTGAPVGATCFSVVGVSRPPHGVGPEYPANGNHHDDGSGLR